MSPPTNQAIAPDPRPLRTSSRISTSPSLSSTSPSPLSPANSFASSHRSSTFSQTPSPSTPHHRPNLSPQDPSSPHSYSEPIIPGSTSSPNSSRPGQHNRNVSTTSATSMYSSKSNGKCSSDGQETKPVMAKKDRSNDGTYTRCGRHGDEWLFGDWSITGTVKKLFRGDEGQ